MQSVLQIVQSKYIPIIILMIYNRMLFLTSKQVSFHNSEDTLNICVLKYVHNKKETEERETLFLSI